MAIKFLYKIGGSVVVFWEEGEEKETKEITRVLGRKEMEKRKPSDGPRCRGFISDAEFSLGAH